eukprot:Colp12_sorted_trinity150504_noHs@5672
MHENVACRALEHCIRMKGRSHDGTADIRLSSLDLRKRRLPLLNLLFKVSEYGAEVAGRRLQLLWGVELHANLVGLGVHCKAVWSKDVDRVSDTVGEGAPRFAPHACRASQQCTREEGC